MEAVASRAAVNKTTIYRRWPSRAALVTTVADRLRTALRDGPLPDTGQLETEFVEAFARRFAFSRKTDGRAWRLLDERHNPEVEAIGEAVSARHNEWKSMVSRAVERGELPTGTDTQLLLDLVRAIVDFHSSASQLDKGWLTLAVRTVSASARAGTLVTTRRRRSRSRGLRESQYDRV